MRHNQNLDIERPLPQNEPHSPHLRSLRQIQQRISTTVSQTQSKLRELGKPTPSDPEAIIEVNLNPKNHLVRGTGYQYMMAKRVSSWQTQLQSLLQREATLYQKHRDYLASQSDSNDQPATQ